MEFYEIIRRWGVSMNFKTLKNNLCYKLYLFVDEIASEYRYACRVAEGEKPSLYPKKEEDD